MKFPEILASLILLFLLLASCKNDSNTPDPTPPVIATPDSLAIIINPSAVKQEMVGFGGALTWYSNWLSTNNKVNEIADLLFTDLGIDIIRFKNWYYPANYPTDKTVTTMPDDNAKVAWDATNKLYELAKARNPGIKILLSSWGPPKILKSNNQLQEGTLSKDGNGFMYDAFAQYWEDVLNNVPFNPDYISIQNEPTYTNAGWTTCQWSINETSTLPGYATAFNKVYEKIKNRPNRPIMIGPESQDIPTFVTFSNVLKDNVNCAMYAYHPYNINSSTTSSNVIASLQSVGNFSTKPNLMTEFSDNLKDWFTTAQFIQNTLVYANTSGYIYWKLTWNTPTSGEDAAIISMNSSSASGGYSVTPYFYLLKHFSKNIDAGYHRVESTTTSASLSTSAFISPDNKKITVVVINSGSTAAKVYFQPTGKTIGSVTGYQSKEGSYYKAVTITSAAKSISLPAKSITTVVLAI